jgi:hypothetical protein
MIGGRDSLITRRFTERPEGPGKDWSCVILNFGIFTPISFMVSCLWHPRGARDAFGILKSTSNGRGSEKPRLTSSDMMGSSIFLNFNVDLWFPRSRWKFKSVIRSCWDIGRKGNVAPLSRIISRWGQFGWCWRISCRSEEGLNSELQEIGLGWEEVIILFRS